MPKIAFLPIFILWFGIGIESPSIPIPTPTPRALIGAALHLQFHTHIST